MKVSSYAVARPAYYDRNSATFTDSRSLSYGTGAIGQTVNTTAIATGRSLLVTSIYVAVQEIIGTALTFPGDSIILVYSVNIAASNKIIYRYMLSKSLPISASDSVVFYPNITLNAGDFITLTVSGGITTVAAQLRLYVYSVGMLYDT